jgi:hypothetical protein
MGRERICRVEFGEQVSEGKALLETNEILFRGDFRLKIARGDIRKIEASDGQMRVHHGAGVAIFHLGEDAGKWADKFLHPPTTLEKLGIRAGIKVALSGKHEPEFRRELTQAGASVVRSGADLLLLALDNRQDLTKVTGATPLWVIYPKGVKHITEMDVIRAGRAAGLVDTKVASFSNTHTALKFSLRKS